MPEGKHTPGPWMVTATEDCYCVANAGRYVIVPERGKVKADNSEADARLIAAAPELLAALERMLSKAYKQNWNDNYPEELEQAESAIAKAKGDS